MIHCLKCRAENPDLGFYSFCCPDVKSDFGACIIVIEAANRMVAYETIRAIMVAEGRGDLLSFLKLETIKMSKILPFVQLEANQRDQYANAKGRKV